MIKGSKHTIKSKKKMRTSSLGQKAWNKNQQKITCKICRKDFYVSPSRKNTASFCSQKCKGKFQIGQILTEKQLLALKIGQGLNKKPKAKRECKFCGNHFEVWFSILNRKERGNYCSKLCSQKSRIGRVSPKKGIKLPHLSGKNNSNWKGGWKNNLPKCLDCKIGLKNMYAKRCAKCHSANITGKNHYLWIEDRNLLKKSDTRRTTAYSEWRINVYKRDKFKCRIADNNCKGRIEAHHILSWKNYPELRYEINNGITLCRFHHPRKRADEINLSPYFQELVNNTNN